MTELFGRPIADVMYGVLVLLAISLVVLVFIAWRHPLLLRLGIRNITRRPSQTLLIVIGLMLSTLIISAAFATGDTVGYSIANQVYEELQETDIVLGFDPERAPVGSHSRCGIPTSPGCARTSAAIAILTDSRPAWRFQRPPSTSSGGSLNRTPG